MNYVCINGELVNEEMPVIRHDDKSYRYGDGLFETMRLAEGEIKLVAYHFDRLWNGMHLLDYNIPDFLTREQVLTAIKTLCKKNDCLDSARVRLSVSSGNGLLFDSGQAAYLIEASPLNKSMNNLQENGVSLNIFRQVRKSCDALSNLKSASFLVYSAAANYARKNQLNDCLVLNQFDRIADSTIANVFALIDNTWITPALSEGCVAGVMRQHLLEKMLDKEISVKEGPLSEKDLYNAKEVFLTNAIRRIQWVRQVGSQEFGKEQTMRLTALLAE